MFWKIGGRPPSLAVRLTVWYAAAVIVLLAAAVAAVHLSVTWQSDQDEAGAVGPFLAKVHASRELFLKIPGVDEESPLRVIEPDGRIFHESPLLAREFPEASFPPAGGRAESFTANGQRYILYTREFDGWRYQIGCPRTGEWAFIGLVYRNMAIAVVPTLAAAVLSGFLIAQAGLRPLRRVAAEVRAVSDDSLHHRVGIGGVPHELADVADSFNATLDRLSAAVIRLDQFAADVAHELRTPVHNLRTAAELALRSAPGTDPRPALAGVVDEADRVARLIDRLLLLARLADPRAGLMLEEIDVTAELGAVADFFEPAATDAGVVVCVDAAPGLSHKADRALFQRAVSNLVANALAYTPTGGRVDLRAWVGPSGLIVEVADTGKGIPAEDVPHLFDRYYRPERAAEGGLGLGLTIVKRVAELHGGAASVESFPGRGTTARLAFPLSDR
jgi:two-component system heavy metal sensor histidine kinase CusS